MRIRLTQVTKVLLASSFFVLCGSGFLSAQNLDVQAINEAKRFFSRMYKKCGEHYYYKYRERRWHLYQCKYAPTITVDGKTLRPKVLSEADRLNGVDPLPVAWEGRTQIQLGLCRTQVYFNPVELGVDSWSGWSDVNNHALTFKNVKGEWQFYNEPTGREFYTKDVIVPVACEDLPDAKGSAPIEPPRWFREQFGEGILIPANYPHWFYVGTGPMKIRNYCKPCSFIYLDGTSNQRSMNGGGTNPDALAPDALLGSVVAKLGKTGKPFQLFLPRAMSNYDGYTIKSTDEVYLAINDSIFTDNRGAHTVSVEGKNVCLNCQPPLENEPTKSLPFDESFFAVKTVGGGILNGKATSLPKPTPPKAAIAVGAKGTVTVQVIVDEHGNVISAQAVSGHPLLRAAAASAARSAKFEPPKVGDQAVKLSGVLTYNF